MRWNEIKKASNDTSDNQNLNEGKTYPVGRGKVRIDNPTHGRGKTHAHVSKGVVNKDGTSSHGTGPFRLTRDEHDFLVNKGFTLKSRLIESGEHGEHFVVEELSTEAREILESFRQAKYTSKGR